MRIELLKLLEKYPDKGNKKSRGLTLDLIEELEKDFAPAGKKFPKALREFLFLAGSECVYFNSGIDYPLSEFKGVQQWTNAHLASLPYKFSYSHIWSFGIQQDSTQFYFIDLNDDKNDPIIYFTDTGRILEETETEGEFIKDTDFTLVSFIDKHITFYFEKGRAWDR